MIIKIVYNEIEMMKMYKAKKKKKNKVFFIVGPILVFLLLIGSFYLGYHPRLLKDISMMIEKCVMYPFTSLTEDKGITQSDSYLIQKNANESLEKDIQELKDLVELNKSLTEYTPINATVLSRNKSYWFNTLTIDKGTSSGIQKDMAVITKNGLIGKISKVSDNSSEIKLITSDDIHFKVSIAIKISDVDTYAIMNGFDSKKRLIKADGIDKTIEVPRGALVVTSGLGEMFPSGITIGTVEEVESDKYNLSKTIYIKTYQNFNNIHYVTVLKVKS